MKRQELREEAFDKFVKSKNAVIAKDFLQNKPVVTDTTEYIAVKLTGSGSGSIPITDSSANKSAGVQSFNSDKLEAGEHLVIDAIKLDYALEVTTDTKKVGNASYVDVAPAELMNAELVIKQGSELLRIPVSDIHNPNLSNNNSDKFRVIGHMPIIEADRSFEVNIEFPKSVSLSGGTDDHFVRVEFRGFKTKKK